MSAHAPDDLRRIYDARFTVRQEYRRAVWDVLIGDFFQQFVAPTDRVLDLGCGYGEFINRVPCGTKAGMDMNPDTPKHLAPGVEFFQQDCSQRWPLPDGSLDVVFTSNFFEHLRDKTALGSTLDEICRCLAPGGRLIAMGPNIKFLPGSYWDFWDHYVPLTELSLSEALTTRGMDILRCEDRFLPYTMSSGPSYPLAFLRLYLRLPFAWKLFGKQFLVVAGRPKRNG
jgi:SAM-dependent methyltransferase